MEQRVRWVKIQLTQQDRQENTWKIIPRTVLIQHIISEQTAQLLINFNFN